MASETTSRRAKTPRGIRSMFHDCLRTVFGVQADTLAQIDRIVRQSGEWQKIYNHITSNVGTSDWRRLNMVLDEVRASTGDEEDDDTDYESKEPGQDDKKASPKKEDDKKAEPKKEDDKKEKTNESFSSYLMELSSIEIARSTMPEKGERMRRARTPDRKLERERMQDIDALRKSTDPIDKQIYQYQQKIAQLMQKKKDMVAKGKAKAGASAY